MLIRAMSADDVLYRVRRRVTRRDPHTGFAAQIQWDYNLPADTRVFEAVAIATRWADDDSQRLAALDRPADVDGEYRAKYKIYSLSLQNIWYSVPHPPIGWAFTNHPHRVYMQTDDH